MRLVWYGESWEGSGGDGRGVSPASTASCQHCTPVLPARQGRGRDAAGHWPLVALAHAYFSHVDVRVFRVGVVVFLVEANRSSARVKTKENKDFLLIVSPTSFLLQTTKVSYGCCFL